MKQTIIPFMINLCIMSSIFYSCSKDGGNCVSSSGEVIMQNRQLSEFDSIRVYDYLNVILIPDTYNNVTVEAGRNIITGISTEISGRELILRNNNNCNWLRNYSKPINVYLTVKNLQKIHYESSGNISCTDTIRSGLLKIEMWGGAGNIDLKVNIGEGFFIQQIGTSTLTLNGKCGISNVYAGDFGLLQLKGLKTGYTFVTNNSSNDCYVSATYALEATISSIGNIYYSGNPRNIKYDITGSGKLIQN